MNTRLVAAKVLSDVIRHGKSLTAALANHQSQFDNAQEASLGQALCYGVCRQYFLLAEQADHFLDKRPKGKDSDVWSLLLIGLYQLQFTNVPDYAAVDSVMQPAGKLKQRWASGVINGVLRNFQRETPDFEDQTAHPAWLKGMLAKRYPEEANTIMAANNQQAPMTLRVNVRKTTRDSYLALLENQGIEAKAGKHSNAAVILGSPVNVAMLPHFDDGWVSVQDEAAQLAAQLLNPSDHQRVLDACAAPGGKACHLLEQANLELTALDNDEERSQRIDENLQRLGLTAQIAVGDAAKPETWWNQQAFDAILLDVPCSATGVIRRHPDIKLLRKPEDIATLVAQQKTILEACWQLLKPGGRLLYSTCSVLPAENRNQIEAFVTASKDASLEPIQASWGFDTGWGQQILPGNDEMDGFFYACLIKN